ncbi:MAG: hypothetical protein H6745_30620 [Deltaproteobacteria bacterium]|nr:hypothetical protein [Deltaproteobacteria bacterium]
MRSIRNILAALGLVALAAPAALAGTSVTLESGHDAAGTDADALFDGRTVRPWILTQDGDAPVAFSLDFGRERWLASVRIFPGHGMNPRTFAQYARPARVRLTWDGGERVVELADKRERQTIDMGSLAVARTLTVTIEAVAGDPADGVAIGEIELVERHDPAAGAPALKERIERQLGLLGGADDERADRAQAYFVRFGEQAAPSLARAVASSTSPLRERALATLVAIGGDDALAVVRELVARGGEERERAFAALDAYPRLAGVESVLRPLVEGPDPVLARRALDLLARSGAPVAREILATAIASGDPARVDDAIRAAGDLSPASARLLAERLLASKDTEVQAAGLLALAPVAAADADALALIVRSTTARDATTRLAATRALGDVKTAAGRAALEALMESEDLEVASAAAESMVRQGPVGIARVAELQEKLRPALLVRALDALHRDASRESEDLLVQCLAAGVWTTFYGRAMGELDRRGDAGVAAVIRWLGERPGDARAMRSFLMDRAARAVVPATALLKRLTVGGPHRDYLDAQVLMLALLRESGDPHVDVDVVLATYRTSVTAANVHRAAFDALTHVASRDEVAPLVVKALDDNDPEIRRLAFAAAGRYQLVEALPRVKREIDATRPANWDPGVVTAYGALGGEEAITLLRHNYPLASYETRVAILDAAWQSGLPAGIELLVDAMSSNDRKVRQVARALLVRPR